MTYNLTQVASNSTGILGFTQGVNEVLMFGWLGTLFLIGAVFIAITSFYYVTQDTAKSFAAGAFIAFGMAFFLRAMSLISPLVLYITLILSGATIAFTWRR